MANTKLKTETFYISAPEAKNVQLVGDFTGWERNPIPLTRQKTGIWKAAVSLEPGTHEYRFVVDGEWRDDPESTMRVRNPFNAENCVRVVESEIVLPKPRGTRKSTKQSDAQALA
jgi:1,4-alpha-glucan branching enzyme